MLAGRRGSAGRRCRHDADLDKHREHALFRPVLYGLPITEPAEIGTQRMEGFAGRWDAETVSGMRTSGPNEPRRQPSVCRRPETTPELAGGKRRRLDLGTGSGFSPRRSTASRWSLGLFREADLAPERHSVAARSRVTKPVPVTGTAAKPAAESPWAVETHGLTKRFGDNVAVNGVELLVPRGCAFGYLGPNGAGKTTLIRVLLGLTHADAGTMSLLGSPGPQTSRRGAGPGRGHRRRAPVPRPSDRAGRTCRSSPPPANRRRGTASSRPSSGSASCTAPTTGCRSTRWACASASGWPPA